MVTKDFDKNIVNMIWKHPEILSLVRDDLCGGIENIDLAAVGAVQGLEFYLMVADGEAAGIINLRHKNVICGEIHVAFLPHARGRIALHCFREALGFMFREGLLKIITTTPSYILPARIGLVAAGFVREGINRNSVLKGGKLYDMIYYGLERKEFFRKGAY